MCQFVLYMSMLVLFLFLLLLLMTMQMMMIIILQYCCYYYCRLHHIITSNCLVIVIRMVIRTKCKFIDLDQSFLHTSTLTPMHLRKAKLMFFYVRYPSSAILKVYFPDVKFNKNNTAQLIKWFSNFR